MTNYQFDARVDWIKHELIASVETCLGIVPVSYETISFICLFIFLKKLKLYSFKQIEKFKLNYHCSLQVYFEKKKDFLNYFRTKLLY